MKKCRLPGSASTDVIEANDYRIVPEGIFLKCMRKGKVHWKRLAYFSARIITEVVTIDDGVEHIQFEILAIVAGEEKKIIVAAEDFANLKWAAKKLGVYAVMSAGYVTPAHVATAIQLHSGVVPKRRVYEHTGWIDGADGPVYLHTGGAIGAADFEPVVSEDGDRPSQKSSAQNNLPENGPKGPIPGERGPGGVLCATLPGSLADFKLPLPPKDPREVIRCALDFLKLGPARIVYALFAAIWRAVLGKTRYGLHIVGPSGVFKTEIAALMQQFVGPEMDSGNLKAAWSGTANSLESLSHCLKDSLVVVDDFVPSGGQGETNRLNYTAERLFRGLGNASGRSRSTSSGSFRAGKFSRALIVSTGEDLPAGHSLRARLLVVQVEKGDINTEALTRCQAHARSGRFAQAMAAFIAWIASDYEAIAKELDDDREQWRSEPSVFHRRIYEMCHELEFGLVMFTRFATQAGVMSEDYADHLDHLCFESLGELADSQQRAIQTDDPVEKFVNLLTSLFAAKNVHLGCRYNEPYPDEFPEAWGYRQHITPVDPGDETDDEDSDSIRPEPRTTWVPCGTKIGWIFGGYIYLNPEVAFAQIEALAKRIDTPLGMSLLTLQKRLADRGIVEPDASRDRIRTRITVEGVRRYVLAIPSHKIQWLANQGPHPEELKDFEQLLEA